MKCKLTLLRIKQMITRLNIFLVLFVLASGFATAQTQIKGKVVDSDDKPLVGVTVVVSKTAAGTVTNLEGDYQITVPKTGTALEFSYIGYQPQTVIINNRSLINVKMVLSADQIDEVVVVGYGTSRRKDLTGSVASIKSELLEDKMLFSLDDALQGGVAGLMVSSSSGQPGASSTMLIRGASSLSGATNPLVVVDGAPMFDVSTSIGGGVSEDQMSGLSLINPADIASIEVLKDVSATAIYGNRGANGVILITTKRGSGIGTKVNYSGYVGLQELTRQYDMMDFGQYVTYQQIQAKNNNLFTNPSTGEGYLFDPRTPSRNWQDEIYRTGFVQNHNVSVQHSKENTSLIFSTSYMQNESVLIETNWRKFTAKAGADQRLGKVVKVGVDINYSRIQDDGVPTGGEGVAQNAGVVLQALTSRPYDLKDPNTQAFFRRAGVLQNILDSSMDNYKGNPVNIARSTDMFKQLSKVAVNSYLQFDLRKDLVFKVTGYWDDFNLNDKQFYPYETPRGRFHNTQAIVGNVSSTSWVNENTLTWSPVFQQKHRLNVMGGITEQGQTGYYTRNEMSDFEYEGLGVNNAQMAKKFNTFTSKNASRFMSFLFRANYSYDSRYIGTFTVRRDGSSSFVNNKWGTFYSGAVAWNLSEEKFLRDVKSISVLKLRASYGEVGNSNVPTTGAYSQLYNTLYPFGDSGSIGQSAASIANENLTWETTREFNVGLDYGMFNNRLTLTADFYSKTTHDLLLEAPIVNIQGFDKAWQNIGNLRNRGFELSLTAGIIKSKNITWDFNINFAKNNSEILKLGGNGDPIFLSIPCLGDKQGIILREGGAIGEFYGYVTEGVYGLGDFKLDGKTPMPGVAVETGNERPGHMKFKDSYVDGKITADDREVLGKSQPDFFGAFGTSFSWKSWNLALGFQYSYGGSIYNANYTSLARFNSEQHNQMAFWGERWTPDNVKSTQYAAMTVGQVCSAYVEDASFLRFKSARVTFTTPPRWFTRKGSVVSSIKMYVACDNVYCFTKYSGYDPEVSSRQNQGMTSVLSSGFDYGTFPRARTFSLGLNIMFQ